MNNNKLNLDSVYEKILVKSFYLIKEKKVDLNELAIQLGYHPNKLVEIFEKEEKDLTVYLKLYDTLMLW